MRVAITNLEVFISYTTNKYFKAFGPVLYLYININIEGVSSAHWFRSFFFRFFFFVLQVIKYTCSFYIYSHVVSMYTNRSIEWLHARYS